MKILRYLLIAVCCYWSPTTAQEDTTPATPLSATGAFTDMASQTPAPELIAYQVNSPLWSDGTFKTRYIWLPAGATIDFAADTSWTFPAGTALIKNFYIDFEVGNAASRRIIETRFLIKRATDSGWDGYSYKWNEAGTEAELLDDAFEEFYFIEDANHPDGIYFQDYLFPSSKQCQLCHTPSADYVLGVTTAQLNRATEGQGNQLAALAAAGLFAADLTADPADLPQLPDPADASLPLDLRARSYLDANCGHCHRPASAGRTVIDLRYSTPLEATSTVDFFPTLGSLGAPDPRIIFPGQPDNSTLYLRMLDMGDFRMPGLATSRIDTLGTGLIRRWIVSLDEPTHVATVDAPQPGETALQANFPNPFNASTVIPFAIDQHQRVELSLYNTAGQKVRTLVRSDLAPGSYRATWDGLDDDGSVLASGMYFYRLHTAAFEQTRRLTLVR